MTTASPPPPPCLTPQMHGLPPWLHHPVILFLLLFVLASSSASAVATTTIPTTAALPPPSPSAPSFQVPTPYGTLAYRVIEESRVLFLKLVTRARSSYISTTVGPVHVLRCIGKKGASLPPVVLVHGVCATGHDFLPLLNGLRKCCEEVIVLDLPGHGKSGIHVDDPDFQTLVASVIDVIQHTVITTPPMAPTSTRLNNNGKKESLSSPISSPPPSRPKILLIGNSLGGLVAIRVALQIPHHIAALALLSPAGAPLTADELSEVKRLFQLQNQEEGLAFVERVCAFPERLPRALRAIMSWACRMRTSSGAIHVIMNKAQPSHMLTKKDLKGLKDTPTLFVWGKHEKVLHAHGLVFFRKHLSEKSTAFCCDENFGHVPFLDDPKRLLAIMQGFFEKACNGAGVKGA